ncbi:hypothetical protein H3V53_06360 [Paraburkholderia bengalensis]|uniref:Uncharacterized protein n=1 Tax=Paraburkholderia bengalensis TaxID=2747562 RepID=A0ABU8IMU6_9BURK
MQVRNVRWEDQEKTQILCEILFDDGPLAGQWAPYRATKNDPVNYGQILFEDLAAGKYGTVAEQGVTGQ